jgi:hypothetical protein
VLAILRCSIETNKEYEGGGNISVAWVCGCVEYLVHLVQSFHIIREQDSEQLHHCIEVASDAKIADTGPHNLERNRENNDSGSSRRFFSNFFFF